MADEPTIDLTPVALEGEGFDRAFETPSGNRFRVRIVRSHASAPVPNAAPTGMTLTITLALLDQDNRVQRLGNGYRIFDPFEVMPIFSGQPFDMEAMVMRSIADAALIAERAMANQAGAHDYLAQWGIAPADKLQTEERNK